MIRYADQGYSQQREQQPVLRGLGLMMAEQTKDGRRGGGSAGGVGGLVGEEDSVNF